MSIGDTPIKVTKVGVGFIKMSRHPSCVIKTNYFRVRCWSAVPRYSSAKLKSLANGRNCSLWLFTNEKILEKVINERTLPILMKVFVRTLNYGIILWHHTKRCDDGGKGVQLLTQWLGRCGVHGLPRKEALTGIKIIWTDVSKRRLPCPFLIGLDEEIVFTFNFNQI